jgi:hypothetical protein
MFPPLMPNTILCGVVDAAEEPHAQSPTRSAAKTMIRRMCGG